MKLRQGKMLSNFKNEGFWGELQVTLEKRSGGRLWGRPGESLEGCRGLPEASQRPQGAFGRRRGRPGDGGHDF